MSLDPQKDWDPIKPDFSPLLFTLNHSGQILDVDPRTAQRLGYRPKQMIHHSVLEFVAPSDRSGLRIYLDRQLHQAATPDWQGHFVSRDHHWVHVTAIAHFTHIASTSVLILVGQVHAGSTSADSNSSGSTSADSNSVDPTNVKLNNIDPVVQTVRSHTSDPSLSSLLTQLALQIQQLMPLDLMLNTVVTDLQQMLGVDRVLVSQFLPDCLDSSVIVEATTHQRSMLGRFFRDPFIGSALSGQPSEVNQVPVQAIADVQDLQLDEATYGYFEHYNIRAQVTLPIFWGDRLWGFLSLHQCGKPRGWPTATLDGLKQLVLQLGIAIQQSELIGQVQRLNSSLDRQVRQRTMQLQLAYDCEDTLKRITDRVRDSLDETHILQTVVKEITLGLGIKGCNAALLDLDSGTSKICYEYPETTVTNQRRVSKIHDFPELYGQLLANQHFQFCSLLSNPERGRVSMLVCPIRDDRGILGSLWLLNHSYYCFNEQDIRLGQQVANQCAIALRQARLYQASQAQVQELARLNQLKDDFLSTVSHELRTPMASMKMALHNLGFSLNQDQNLFSEFTKPLPDQSRTARYFQILRQECEREIQLIEDLLTLQRVSHPDIHLPVDAFEVQTWLSDLIHGFQLLAKQHHQTLHCHVTQDLPSVQSERASLTRIVKELLDNACKYTPSGGEIQIDATVHGDQLQIQVCNSGVEIPPDELPHIFEKFYRVPNENPWRYRGTGLGLALVRQLVIQLGGTIQVSSDANQTCFTLAVPLIGSN